MEIWMRAVALAALTLTAAAALSACSGAQPPGGSPAERTRAQDDPILGVAAPANQDPPECAAPVVERTPDVPTAELTVAGQPGDTFTYEIRKKDGTTASGTSGEFGPDQREVVFATGVPNADIELVTISADGPTGTPGTCTITTIT
ncbi:hypothetical protein ABT324_06720 [Saccharopolyspora sp. NPDC000359]|uniref:hypothetical protein n=1 Tax=Saccharopolyspora sp. NPDC000359 TaxID=3154251 RepID=UPI00331C8BAD